MKEKILKKIKNKEIIVGVIGLGYVGLPLAVKKPKRDLKLSVSIFRRKKLVL